MDSIIPQNFIKTIQEDGLLIYNSLTGKTTKTPESAQKVTLAALRIITTVGMAIASLYLLYTLPFYFSYPIGTILKVAIAVTCLLVDRDLFVMSKNATDQMGVVKNALATGKALWQNLKDFASETKTVDDAPTHPLTENTFFRPFWDAAIARIPQRQEPVTEKKG